MTNRTNPDAWRRRAAMALLLVSTSGLSLAQEVARDFPSKAITLVVPYAAGGSSDTRARQVAEKLASVLGKPVIVDNKPGGNGNIGTDFIARATPDGHTIGIGNFAPLAVNRHLYPKMSYNPLTDLVPVILLERGPLVLVVNAEKSTHRSVRDLVAAAKASPGRLSYASAGSGGAFHLAGEMFKSNAGIFTVHIPYRGGAPATNDLLSGQVDYMFDMVPAAMGYLRSQPPRMRALAVATEKRLPSMPDVPTFSEVGLKDMEISNWFGIVAPKGTPAPVVARLNQALNKVLQDPDLSQRITTPGNVVGGGTPEAFASFVAAESARWGRLIKERGIQPE